MSYYRRNSYESDHLVDRLPVYVFPAFVGSGRMLLGMALAGLTTAIIMKTRLIVEPMMWWLAGCAYLASALLIITGVYAVNYLPPKSTTTAHPQEPVVRPPGLSPPVSSASPAPATVTLPRAQNHLDDLLVKRWKIITEEQLARAHTRQANSGRSLVHELSRMGLLTDERLEQILEVQTEANDPWYGASRTS